MELRDVRNQIYEDVKSELLGPGSENIGVDRLEEIITDRASNRYVTGILFANGDKLEESSTNNVTEIEEKLEEKIEAFKSELVEENIVSKNKEAIQDDNSEYYEEMNNAHIIKKRAMGLTIFCNNDIEHFKVNIKGARYKRTLLTQCMIKYDRDLMPLKENSISKFIYNENGFLKLRYALEYEKIKEWENKGYFKGHSDFKEAVYKLCLQYQKSYKRKEIVFQNPIVIDFSGNNKAYVELKDEELRLFALKRKYESGFSITVMLINEAKGNEDEKFVFQPEIIINSEENNTIFIPSRALNTSVNPNTGE